MIIMRRNGRDQAISRLPNKPYCMKCVVLLWASNLYFMPINDVSSERNVVRLRVRSYYFWTCLKTI